MTVASTGRARTVQRMTGVRLFPYGYGTYLIRLSLDDMWKRPSVRMLDPEFSRRLRAMFNAAADEGRELGIGGAGRSSAGQRKVFLERHVEDPTGPISWDGRRWRLKANAAPAAPPGQSYHEETTPDGGVLAVDLIGDIAWANRNCARFGLRDFSKVGKKPEPWHFQPVEIPTGRGSDGDGPSGYDPKRHHPLPAFPLPGASAPQPAPAPQPTPAPQPAQAPQETPPAEPAPVAPPAPEPPAEEAPARASAAEETDADLFEKHQAAQRAGKGRR